MKRIFIPAALLLLALLAGTAAAADAELEVLLSPKQKALRENVEAHVGSLGGQRAAGPGLLPGAHPQRGGRGG